MSLALTKSDAGERQFPLNGSIEISAECCPGAPFKVITGGGFVEPKLVEAKALVQCTRCKTTWLLLGQARTS